MVTFENFMRVITVPKSRMVIGITIPTTDYGNDLFPVVPPDTLQCFYSTSSVPSTRRFTEGYMACTASRRVFVSYLSWSNEPSIDTWTTILLGASPASCVTLGFVLPSFVGVTPRWKTIPYKGELYDKSIGFKEDDSPGT